MIDKPEFIRQTQNSHLSSRFGLKTGQSGYQSHDGPMIFRYFFAFQTVYTTPSATLD